MRASSWAPTSRSPGFLGADHAEISCLTVAGAKQATLVRPWLSIL
jgi:hypothetical protein